jgi:hypothetical protein
MRVFLVAITACLLAPVCASAQQSGATYRWVDDEGVVHYGDKIPAEYAEKPKQILNEQGITVDHLQGKKSAEELEAERVAEKLRQEQELQRRADMALLATYVNVTEIEMHRDRRVELFQAQARVTELYLRNLQRRLDKLRSEAGRFKPYNSDPAAATVDPSLIEEINETEDAIARHEGNLTKYQSQEKKIKDRFQGDINRFMALKGLTVTQAQAVPE